VLARDVPNQKTEATIKELKGPMNKRASFIRNERVKTDVNAAITRCMIGSDSDISKPNAFAAATKRMLIIDVPSGK
jgi:hypothetical protein